MPELDGLQATRLIRESEAGTSRHIPIIAMTAHARPRDRERCIEAGMDDYVSKPIDPVELAEKMSYFIGEPPDFDPVLALEMMGGDVGVFHEVANMFFDALPDRLGDIEEWIEEADSDALERAAHSLKGAAATLTLWRVRVQAERLEHAGGVGVWEGTPQTVAALKQCLESALDALRAEFD